MKYIRLDNAIEIIKSIYKPKEAKALIALLTLCSEDIYPASVPKATIRDEEDWDWAVFK